MGLRKYLRRALLGRGAERAGTEAAERIGAMITQARREARIDSIHVKWHTVDALESRLAAIHPPATLACPLCGHQAPTGDFREYLSQCIFAGGRLLRHGCPHCEVIFGPGKMFALTSPELDEDYRLHYSVYSEGDSSAQERRAFLSLQPTREGIYLNYGAGRWSDTTRQLREEGWDVRSYDPYAPDGAGAHALSTAQLEQLRFDGVFSNNVLEHLRHPAADLRRQAALLKPDGAIALATPCFAYLYEFTRFHLFFYLGRSRQVLLEQAGLVETAFIEDGEFMNLVCRPAR